MTFLASASCIWAQESMTLSPAQWIADIDYLANQVENIFPEIENRIDQIALTEEWSTLKANLEKMSTDQVVLELQRILGLLQDEGTAIYPFQKAFDQPVLPIKSYWFADGLYICDSREDYPDLSGQKIVRINQVGIDELFEKMLPFLPGDNLTYKKYTFPMYAQVPAWLTAAGVPVTGQTIDLELGNGTQLSLPLGKVADYIALKRNLVGDQQSTFSDTEFQDQPYWKEYIPEHHLLSIQFKRIANAPSGPGFKQFIREIEQDLNERTIDKIVIDNRYGGGGNGFKLKPFTDLIRDHLLAKPDRQLFVLTSRATRGTVAELTSILVNNTDAILIGEDTGEGPNTVGDTKNIILPQSGIRVSITHKFWPTSWEEDSRTSIAPDIYINPTYEQQTKPNAPWYDAVLNYTGPNRKQTPLSKEIGQPLLGTSRIQGRKVRIVEYQGHFYASMGRAMMSFFEFHTQLYYEEEGVLSSDLNDVFFEYQTDAQGKPQLKKIRWKGKLLE